MRTASSRKTEDHVDELGLRLVYRAMAGKRELKVVKGA